MSIETFSEWLYATPYATALRETASVIPAIQSVHILAITVIIGSALVTELRIAGMFATDRPIPDVLRRYLPWMRRALVVLLLTGLLLVVAEPARTLGNALFWIKMALVAGASIITLGARKSLLGMESSMDAEDGADRQDEAEPAGEAGSVQASGAEASKPLAWLMILIWCTIIFCGRFIAYT